MEIYDLDLLLSYLVVQIKGRKENTLICIHQFLIKKNWTTIKIILFRRSTDELKSKQEWNKLDNEGSETSTWALYIAILILVG